MDVKFEVSGRKVLVTGATGFVGSNLIKELVAKKCEVTAIGSKTECSIPNVKKVLYMHLDGIDWGHVAGHDILFHQAANNDTLDQDGVEMYKANVAAPIKLFKAAMDGGCRKFIYASSTAVYGDSPAPYVEDVTKLNPLNEYAKSKAEFDSFAMKFAKEHNVQVVGLRYCNIYGPGEHHKKRRASMIHQLIEMMKNNIQPELFEPGDQKRDWVYVKDIVRANIMSAQSNCTGIFNVGSGCAVTFNKLIELINKNLQKKICPKYIECPFKETYQSYTECNIEKAYSSFGWRPKYNIERGIAELINI